MLLINWYENGEHYIGLHSDDEKTTKETTYYNLNNNHVYIMGGNFQKLIDIVFPNKKMLKKAE